MSGVYNLQIKLDKKTEKILRVLAKNDDRTLSNYCMVVLKKWVEGQEVDVDLQQDEETTTPRVETKTKKSTKLKRPSTNKTVVTPPREVQGTPKTVESKVETITLDIDTPKISGQFNMK